MRRPGTLLLSLLAAGAILPALPAEAYETGDWRARVGVGTVDPKSDDGDVVEVDSGTTLTFNGSYVLNPNFSIEALAALPFSHDIKLESDGSTVGETKHLPPTVSLRYHFRPDSKLRPDAGLGVNYTLFSDESTEGPLSGVDLDLDDSFGLAAQIGFDYDLSDRMFFNAEIRRIDIETKAKLGGVVLETVEIDPIVYAANLGWRF